MTNNKYKILVLSDLKDTASTILKSTVGLAKIIDGAINVFYVRDPSDVVKNENQLSAVRSINEDYKITEKKIQRLIEPISLNYDINIDCDFTFGNVKNEIETYLKEHKPDIIVLGKRKSKIFKLIGDNVTDFVLDKHNGVIMLATDKNMLEPDNELSLGILNGTEQTSQTAIVEALIGYSQKPLKLFQIISNSNELAKANSNSTAIKTVEYVFEKKDDSMKNLSSYLSKNNINLLCVDRSKKNDRDKTNTTKSDIKDVITNLDISMLLTGTQKYNLYQ
jgi:nucleotide-binding universal stress UspA family protein